MSARSPCSCAEETVAPGDSGGRKVKHILAVLIAAGSAALSVAAQSRGAAGASPTNKAWRVPRLPDGTPDLQGVWGNNAVTPMTRPTQWKDKTSLSDAEVQELKGLA